MKNRAMCLLLALVMVFGCAVPAVLGDGEEGNPGVITQEPAGDSGTGSGASEGTEPAPGGTGADTSGSESETGSESEAGSDSEAGSEGETGSEGEMSSPEGPSSPADSNGDAAYTPAKPEEDAKESEEADQDEADREEDEPEEETEAAEEEENVFLISSAADLLTVYEEPGASYALDADIDMTGIDWEPIMFSGVFDGRGHSIINLTITRFGEDTGTTYDGNMKSYPDTHFAGLFSMTNDAVIKNLNLLGVNIDIESEYDGFCAAVTGFAENTVIENCSVECRINLRSGGINQGVAGIVGFGRFTVNNCSVEAVLIQADIREPGGRKAEEFLGGINGAGFGDVNNCSVNVAGYIACNGYVHSGGVIGMLMRFAYPREKRCFVGNTVNGTISFYENNRDRRAYCAGMFGEDLYEWYTFSGNNTDGFTRDELFTYDVEPNPEKCSEPEYTREIIGSCSGIGFTVNTCTVCGNSFKSDYTLAAHSAGEWKTVREADYENSGLEQLSCAFCGEVMEEREIPVLAKPAPSRTEPEERGEISYILSESYMLLPFGTERQLRLLPGMPEGEDTIIWTSSDENAVVIDENGRLKGVGAGTVKVSCSLPDGTELASCEVVVRYTPQQLFVRYVCFGWLWQK